MKPHFNAVEGPSASLPLSLSSSRRVAFRRPGVLSTRAAPARIQSRRPDAPKHEFACHPSSAFFVPPAPARFSSHRLCPRAAPIQRRRCLSPFPDHHLHRQQSAEPSCPNPCDRSSGIHQGPFTSQPAFSVTRRNNRSSQQHQPVAVSLAPCFPRQEQIPDTARVLLSSADTLRFLPRIALLPPRFRGSAARFL
jgi:hypothetical protein